MVIGKFVNRNYKEFKDHRIKITFRNNFDEIESKCGILLNAPSCNDIRCFRYNRYLWFYIELDTKRNISIPLHKVINMYLLQQSKSIKYFIEISKNLKLNDDVINKIIEYTKEWYDITY